MSTLKVQIKQRIDDLSNWISLNPVLAKGEIAVVVDEDGSRNVKIGDGSTNFNNLQYLYQSEMKTDKVTTTAITTKSISQGYNNKSTPTSMATGVFTEASADFGVVHGIEARINTGDNYAFVFNGENLPGIDQRYTSHGEGTFNVNTLSGLSGVYFGEQNMQQILDANKPDLTDYYTKSETSSATQLSTRFDATYLKSETSSATQIEAKDYLSADISGNVYGKVISGQVSDGINWTQSSKTDGNWSSLTYGDGKFVAGSNSNSGLWYSTDGINWTQSNKTNEYSYSLTYGSGKFVAGVRDIILYSTDGINWTNSNIGGIVKVACLTYGNGKFIAGGDNYVFEEFPIGIYYSTDGINWTQSNKQDINVYSLTYGNGKFIAGSKNSGLWYSTDGINWSQSNKTNDSWYSLAYGNGMFIAGSSSSGVWYSTDGINWNLTNTDSFYNSLIYSDGKFIGGGSGLWYSTDGIHWDQTNKTDGNWSSLTYGDGKFVAGSNSNSGLWYSAPIPAVTKKVLSYKEDMESYVSSQLSSIDLSDYYKKTETSSAYEISVALQNSSSTVIRDWAD